MALRGMVHSMTGDSSMPSVTTFKSGIMSFAFAVLALWAAVIRLMRLFQRTRLGPCKIKPGFLMVQNLTTLWAAGQGVPTASASCWPIRPTIKQWTSRLEWGAYTANVLRVFEFIHKPEPHHLIILALHPTTLLKNPVRVTYSFNILIRMPASLSFPTRRPVWDIAPVDERLGRSRTFYLQPRVWNRKRHLPDERSSGCSVALWWNLGDSFICLIRYKVVDSRSVTVDIGWMAYFDFTLVKRMISWWQSNFIKSYYSSADFGLFARFEFTCSCITNWGHKTFTYTNYNFLFRKCSKRSQ